MVKSRNEESLTVVPHLELPKVLNLLFNSDVSIEEINQSIIDELGISKEELTTKNTTVILLPKHDTDYYEELTLSWSETIEVSRASANDGLSMYVPVNPRFNPIGDSSLYVDIRINDKYEFYDSPRILTSYEEELGYEKRRLIEGYRKMEDEYYTNILNEKRHYVVRINRGFSHEVKIECKVGIPHIVKIWSWVGLSLGLGLIPYVVWLWSNPESFQFLASFTGGTIAILIGFRIILYDIELFKRWNWAYILLSAADVVLLAFLGVKNYNWEYFPK